MFGSKKLEYFKNKCRVIFKTRFLATLTTMEKVEFIQLCHRREYKEGEYIYYQNDPGTGMYFIEQGKVQLIVEGAPEEEETPDFILEAPESFGALSLGYELRRMSSAKCLTDCVLLGFFKSDFETLRNRNPRIAVKFLEILSMIALKQLNKTTEALIEATSATKAFSLQFKTYYEQENQEEPMV